ncbi:hypothetical protein [Streptomyces sp. NPDC086787]|uniref:hypothetical protein n=1 Tax=Streptomyces sp. NPDC086787 TaxID=3365759 RepID=UPI003823E21A
MTDPENRAEGKAHGRPYDLPADDSAFTWMIEPDGDSFVVSGDPSWREADRKFDDPSLFDFAQPWPPDFPVEHGSVG